MSVLVWPTGSLGPDEPNQVIILPFGSIRYSNLEQHPGSPDVGVGSVF